MVLGMDEHKFYYRFKPIGIDHSKEQEIRKYNQELVSFEELSVQFDMLKNAYDKAVKTRADIIINALPDIGGVVEISVHHKIKFKFFSRMVRQNVFSLCVDRYNEDNKLILYNYETVNIEEVKLIFREFIQAHILPDLNKWKYTYIG